jgi:site-specific DNA-methyltransferase (adenine-specific)
MPDLATNVLYYGDNLDILRRYAPDASVDLVYLDPPSATDAQLLAFEDT